MAARKPLKKKARETQFYETMPGIYTHPFYAAPPVEAADEYFDEPTYQAETEELTDAQARMQMVKYGIALVALFAIQLILFVLLLRSTLNLG